MDFLIESFGTILQLAIELWWIILPLIVVPLAAHTWKYYLVSKKLKETEWLLLEIQIPREIMKSPEAMERVFAGLHGPYDPPQYFKDNYLKIKVRLWYNFEIVGQGGDMRFFMRLPKGWRKAAEAQMHAQYPGVTIREAEDYAKSLPENMPNDDYDLWGMEMQFAKDNPYPILTYKDFTTLTEAKLEEVKVDPLSAFAEALAKLRPGEQIWFQIMARPCGLPGKGPNDDWQKKGEELVNKLAGREKPKAKPWWHWLADLFAALVEEIPEHLSELAKPGTSSPEQGLGRLNVAAKKDETKKDPSKLMHITQGEKDVISAIESKISKMGFECVVRLIYVARRDVMDLGAIGSLFGIIKQFNTQHLNAFRPNGAALTRPQDYLWGFFQSKRYLTRIKRGLLRAYRARNLFYDSKDFLPGQTFPETASVIERIFPNSMTMLRSKPVVLNIEEMATLFHFPGATVSSPTMPKIEAKQAEPPVNLPL